MNIHPSKRNWILINMIGGPLVIASYVWGVTSPAAASDVGIWGGVPEWLQPTYTVNMLLAASGYFLFAQHLLRTDAARARIGSRDFSVWTPIFAAILIPSALWLPLTQMMLAEPSTAMWIAIRVVLAIVGVGAVALLVGLVRLEPHPGAKSRVLAIAGALPFVFQTAVLDAIVWPYYFPL